MTFLLEFSFVCSVCGSRLKDGFEMPSGANGFCLEIAPCPHCIRSLEEKKKCPEVCPNCEQGGDMITIMTDYEPYKILSHECIACHWKVDAQDGEILYRGDE